MKRVLIIDDEAMAAEIAASALGDKFHVFTEYDALSGLNKANEALPDLILMDIKMPHMSGYEATRRLKADPTTAVIPVIFLSGLTSVEDRMVAFDAGGDDFISKPFFPMELTKKVETAIERAEETKAAKHLARGASDLAMMSMTNSAELGIVIDFMRRSFSAADTRALVDLLFDCLQQFGLHASVALRHDQSVFEASSDGDISPMERGVLNLIATCGRVLERGSRLALNFGGVTLLIKNMPLDDPDRAGRLRDHLAILADALSARFAAINQQALSLERLHELQNLAIIARRGLDALAQERAVDKKAVADVMEALLMATVHSSNRLDLSDAQAALLADMLRATGDKVLALLDRDYLQDGDLSVLSMLLQ